MALTSQFRFAATKATRRPTCWLDCILIINRDFILSILFLLLTFKLMTGLAFKVY